MVGQHSHFLLGVLSGDCNTQVPYFKASTTVFLRQKSLFFLLIYKYFSLKLAPRNEAQKVIMLQMFTYFLSEDIRLALLWAE